MIITTIEAYGNPFVYILPRRFHPDAGWQQNPKKYQGCQESCGGGCRPERTASAQRDGSSAPAVNQSTQSGPSNESSQNTEYENARRTETATGETIIDHHHEHRENNRIFDDEEGEYVEFEEA